MTFKNLINTEKFMNNRFIESVEKVYMKKNLKKLFVGDTVKVGVFVEEGNKERVQFYEGIILAKSKSCINFTISVRKVFQGIGVERAFLVNSKKNTDYESAAFNHSATDAKKI